jgi:hypothetical protein
VNFKGQCARHEIYRLVPRLSKKYQILDFFHEKDHLAALVEKVATENRSQLELSVCLKLMWSKSWNIAVKQLDSV